MKRFLIHLFFLWAISNSAIFAAEYDFRAELSATAQIAETPTGFRQFQFRYLPESNFYIWTNETLSFSAFAAAKFSGSIHSAKTIASDEDLDADFHRWSVKLSGDQFEIRAGLQKLNFGSALLMRPLQWFDQIDPRDPLSYTDGLQALLFRYYFLNNANLWLWSTYDMDYKSSADGQLSENDQPEFGARFQYPLFTGEVALTLHQRNGAEFISGNSIQKRDITRLGYDGKWDVGIGLWLEGSISKYSEMMNDYRYFQQQTIGADYTFAIRNGLHVLLEHSVREYQKTFNLFADDYQTTAISMDYPVGILDRVMLIYYRSWKDKHNYRFVSWQRVYDRWSFFLNLFWNPKNSIDLLDESRDKFQLAGGKGFQISIKFNH